MMEKMNFVKNGVLRLPPGFRFHPTDEELVLQYLKRKVLSCPLPASIIPEVDVCKSDPWDLPGDAEQERYFFSTREVKYPNGNRSNRATGSGYWKATGVDKQIVAGGGGGNTRNRQVVGMKKTLVFYRGKPPHGIRTEWIMHEYRLAAHLQDQLPGNWVLCRVFLKKRGAKSEDETGETENRRSSEEKHKSSDCEGKTNNNTSSTSRGGLVYYDFMSAEKKLNPIHVSSACSGSSGITTEISCNNANGTEDHEESSSCNSFIRPPRRKP